MAIAVDAVSSIADQSNGDPWTWSHTCTGSQLVLVVSVSWYNNSTSISSVTYAGAAMTQAQTATNGTSQAAVFYKIAPATGANNVTVDFSGGAYGKAGAVSFTGADQTTQPDASATETGTSNTTNILNITTVTANSIIVDAIGVESTFTNNDLNSSGATAEVYNTFPTFVDAGASYKTTTTAGAATMTWTWTGAFAEEYVHVGLAVREAGGAPPPVTNTGTGFFMSS